MGREGSGVRFVCSLGDHFADFGEEGGEVGVSAGAQGFGASVFGVVGEVAED